MGFWLPSGHSGTPVLSGSSERPRRSSIADVGAVVAVALTGEASLSLRAAKKNIAPKTATTATAMPRHPAPPTTHIQVGIPPFG